MVYFTLKDNSQAAIDAMIAACKKHLSDHPGTVLFAAETRVLDLVRDVNDREFDIALHVVLKVGKRTISINCTIDTPSSSRKTKAIGLRSASLTLMSRASARRTDV